MYYFVILLLILIVTVKSTALIYGFDGEGARVFHKETYGLLITASHFYVSFCMCCFVVSC